MIDYSMWLINNPSVSFILFILLLAKLPERVTFLV